MAKKPKNILVIGDIHEPFALDGYLKFCQQVQRKYKTDHTVFIGDLIDNHYSSYHDQDPDGYGAGEELQRAVDRMAKWYKAFPKADVCIGNHDRIPARKAFTFGLSRAWLKNLSDVLKVPGWKFADEFIYDDVLYIHGEGKSARTRAKDEGYSVVQGHRHTESYVWHNSTNWGMQVGCGIDRDSYALAYAKNWPRQILSCGVVLDNGQLPLVIPYS